MTHLPLVPFVSQWDSTVHASRNCTCASAARLARYERGITITGGAVRARQSDQTGGTSIPDVMRGLHNGWSIEPKWAAPNDSNGRGDPIPANRTGDYISPTRLQGLLRDGYMVLVQGDYGALPITYREQANFTDDHAFTVDAYEAGRGYYVVDTLPRNGSGYKGRWIPTLYIHRYAYALAGSGRIFAAWTRPDPRYGNDVPADIRAAYAAPAVAAKLRSLGLEYGAIVNLGDIAAGLRKRGMTWGAVINVSDVANLMKPGTGR